METIESWSARPDVRGARLADPDMGAENRRIAPFGPCPGVEFVTLEGIVQPFPLHFHDFWTIGQMVGGRRRMTCRGEVHDLGPEDFVLFGSGEVHGCKPLDDAPLMYRSVVVPVGLFAQAFAESHGIGAASLPDGGPACRFKSVVVRDAALSACMDRLYAFARTDSAHEPASRRKKRFGPSSRRRRGIARARRPSPRRPRPPPRRTWRGRGRTSKNGSPRASLSTTSRAARACRATTSSACSPRRRASRRIATCRAVRANRARDLLAAGVDPAEVAARSGFADQAHMGRVYKSFYGITPGSYRTAARTRVREG